MRRSNGRESTRAEPRVPPHDLDAERALLGSMMLSRDAIKAVTNVRPADFYRPIHGLIYDAIVDLYLEDVLVDPVVLAPRIGPELERHGGKGFLLAMLADTPASANAKAYADVVERAARQRSVIAQAGEVAEAAYTGVDWHDQAAHLSELANRNGVVFNPSSLEVVDLGPILRGEGPEVETFWLKREDGHALLYPGLVHGIHAEPSFGKTWLALRAVKEVLEAGGAAIYIDYEDSPGSITGRLIAIGVDPALLEPEARRFEYLRPTGPLREVELAAIDGLLAELRPDLVIIDGIAEALARDGYAEESNSDVTTWGVRVPRHISDQGPAVLMLDHVKKDVATRARGARGAGAKLALINGASYELRLAIPFSRRKPGLVKILLAKDRNGQVGSIGETVAHLRIDPRHDGREVYLGLELPPATSEFKPTGLMAKLSEHLRAAAAPHSAKLLFDSVRGKREHVKQALALLVVEGYVTESKSDDGEKLYRHLKPYRETVRPDLHVVKDETPEDDVPMREPDPELPI